MRVDLFSTIHKAIRGALFGFASDLARAELSSTKAIDGIVEQVERVLGFLDEHARIESAHLCPVLRGLDPLLADELDRDHRELEWAQAELEEATQALALSDIAARPVAAAKLSVIAHHLIALQLLHMNREETEVNRVLWVGLDDTELVAISKCSAAQLSAPRLAAWQELIRAATNPQRQVVESERQLVGSGRLG